MDLFTVWKNGLSDFLLFNKKIEVKITNEYLKYIVWTHKNYFYLPFTVGILSIILSIGVTTKMVLSV